MLSNQKRSYLLTLSVSVKNIETPKLFDGFPMSGKSIDLDISTDCGCAIRRSRVYVKLGSLLKLHIQLKLAASALRKWLWLSV